jgi:adenylylsulfate kinase
MLKQKALAEQKSEMVIWITGKSGAGKTTLAKELCSKMKAINLDGDDMRASLTKGLGFSDEDRLQNNIKIATLARILEKQGFDIVVSTICPPKVRGEVYKITRCNFIHL